MTVFDIAIISDTVCPWCYIGYRCLSKAITLYQKTYPGGSKDIFNIEWKPYYSNPDAPTEGILIQERMVNRMGSERTLSAQKYMTSLGRAEGIEIKYGGKTGNTRISHQLLLFARSKSLAVQNKVAQELFRLHFSEERYIGDMQTLLDPAKNCGLDVNEVQEYLEQGVAAEEVDREAAAIQDLTGRKGVPNFRLQEGQYVVDGAGDTMEFFELLMKIKSDSCVMSQV